MMIKKPENLLAFTLPVKHRSQLDNTGGQGYRECFLTAATMLAEYLLSDSLSQSAKLKGYAEPEDIYAEILKDFGDTTDWAAQVKTLKKLGLDCYSSKTASLNDVHHALCQGVPVLIGTKYGTSGHIVLVVGRTPQGFEILCPNGIRAGSSTGWIRRFSSEAEARPDHYSWHLLNEIFTDLGPEAGWALFVTAVEGVSTGVREGL